jgi:hypothetical protein
MVVSPPRRSNMHDWPRRFNSELKKTLSPTQGFGAACHMAVLMKC